MAVEYSQEILICIDISLVHSHPEDYVFFIYSQSFLVITVLGSGSLPTIFANASLGFIAFINAGLGALYFESFFSDSFISILLMFVDLESEFLYFRT